MKEVSVRSEKTGLLNAEISRRLFLRVLGISVASAILTSCEKNLSTFFPTESPSPTPKPTETENLWVPENYQSSRFLTLPFPKNPKMAIQQGWFYNWKDESGNPAKHQGIDFIKGEIDKSSTWEPFDVLAAADGWVCSNPPLRLGNALFAVHLVKINGNLVPIYTYYGHLQTIENGIPSYDAQKKFLGGVPVRRGEKIGIAGASGVTNEKGEPEPTWRHLHLGVQDADGPLDPYDLHGERNVYPNPNSLSAENLGPHSLWK